MCVHYVSNNLDNNPSDVWGRGTFLSDKNQHKLLVPITSKQADPPTPGVIILIEPMSISWFMGCRVDCKYTLIILEGPFYHLCSGCPPISLHLLQSRSSPGPRQTHTKMKHLKNCTRGHTKLFDNRAINSTFLENIFCRSPFPKLEIIMQ